MGKHTKKRAHTNVLSASQRTVLDAYVRSLPNSEFNSGFTYDQLAARWTQAHGFLITRGNAYASVLRVRPELINKRPVKVPASYVPMVPIIPALPPVQSKPVVPVAQVQSLSDVERAYLKDVLMETLRSPAVAAMLQTALQPMSARLSRVESCLTKTKDQPVNA